MALPAGDRTHAFDVLVVVCAGDVGLPHGTAPAVRATAYARMHVCLGLGAEVHVVGPSETAGARRLNTRVRGRTHGVDYRYTCGRTTQSRFRAANLLAQLYGIARSAQRLVTLSRQRRVRAVLVYPCTLRVAVPLAVVARICGFPLLLDVSEIPLDKSFEPVSSGLGPCRQRLLYSLYDGVLAISDRLCDFARSHSTAGLALMKMPVLMDGEPFAPSGEPALQRRIVYVGFLNERKDGVATLLKAFADLPASDDDVQLVLAGPETALGDQATLRRSAVDLGVSQRVVFTGRLDRDEVREVLSTATVLALARPSSAQAEAGFPTKLSEYLATGHPVVVTATGEIPRFLGHRRAAFLVAPGDHLAFANALHKALDNPAEASMVGARGRAVALRTFDFRANAPRFDAFIGELESRVGRRRARSGLGRSGGA